MEGVLIALAALACPVGMGVMMWFMAKGAQTTRRQPPASVEDLRAEHDRLTEEIERREREQSRTAGTPRGA